MPAIVAIGILVEICLCHTARGDEASLQAALQSTRMVSTAPATAQLLPASSARRFRRRIREHERQLERERQQFREDIFEAASSEPETALSDCLAKFSFFTADERVQLVRDALGPIELELRETDWRMAPLVDWLSELYPSLEKLIDDANRLQLPPDVEVRLRNTCAQCRLLCASLCTEELDRLSADGAWSEVSEQSIDLRDRLPAAVLIDAQPMVDFIVEIGLRREAADQLHSMLTEPSLDQWRVPTGLDLVNLPVEVRRPVQTLQILADIRHSVEDRETLDVPHVLERIRPLERSPGFRDHVLKLRQSVSFNLFLHGDPSGARRLLPQAGDRNYFQAVLRDIKTIAVGEGELDTWPARRLLVEDPGVTPSNQRAPATAIIAPSGDSTMQFSNSNQPDVPVWEDPGAIESPIRKEIEETVDQWSSPTEVTTLHRTAQRALELYQRQIELIEAQGIPDDSEDEVTCLESVRQLMGRELELDEEFLARRLCLEGESPTDVVGAIHKAAGRSVGGED